MFPPPVYLRSARASNATASRALRSAERKRAPVGRLIPEGDPVISGRQTKWRDGDYEYELANTSGRQARHDLWVNI